jgi:hypothetical protein
VSCLAARPLEPDGKVAWHTLAGVLPVIIAFGVIGALLCVAGVAVMAKVVGLA